MDEMITVAEAAVMLRVSVKTLQRWDREKKLVANRTATKRRWYTREQIARFRGAEVATVKQPETTPPAATALAVPLPLPPATPPASVTPPKRSAPAPRIITDPSDPEYVPGGDDITETAL